MTGPATPHSRLYQTFGMLMVLLAATAAATALPAGWWSTPLSLAIALAKAALIFSIFMRLKDQSTLVRIFAGVGFFFLAILLVLASSDYFTRSLTV